MVNIYVFSRAMLFLSDLLVWVGRVVIGRPGLVHVSEHYKGGGLGDGIDVGWGFRPKLFSSVLELNLNGLLTTLNIGFHVLSTS